MIETLKTKLQELNNLSQSLNDQLEQLRQQLDERPRFLSLSSLSGSDSDLTDLMSTTLSDESLFDENSNHSTNQNQNDNNTEPAAANNNAENTNTASDVVDQVERTIVTTLFDVSSRLEVVRNQMRAVLDAGFTNDNENIHFDTPALYAIINNNSTVGTSANTGTGSGRVGSGYARNNTNENNAYDPVYNFNNLSERVMDDNEHSTEARDGDVMPENPPRLLAHSSEAHSDLSDEDLSFSERYNHDSNQSLSDMNESYQYTSRDNGHSDSHNNNDDDDRDENHGDSSRHHNSSHSSSRNQSFSDQCSRDERTLPDHVIMSDPPDSPSNSNSSFSSLSSSIPTFSSISNSPDYTLPSSPITMSTPRGDRTENDDGWEGQTSPPTHLTSDSYQELSETEEEYGDPTSESHHSSHGDSSPHSVADSDLNRSHHSQHSGDHDDHDHGHSTADSDVDSHISQKSSCTTEKSFSEQSAHSDHDHGDQNVSSQSSMQFSPNNRYQEISSVDGSDDDHRDTRHSHHGDRWNKYRIENANTTTESLEPSVSLPSEVSMHELSRENGDADRRVEHSPQEVLSCSAWSDKHADDSGQDVQHVSSSTSADESKHRTGHISLPSDSTEESDQSESIKYLTKRLKHKKDRETHSETKSHKQSSGRLSNDERKVKSLSADNKKETSQTYSEKVRGDNNNSRERLGRKRRGGGTEPLYQGSQCKKTNTGATSNYASYSQPTSMASHTVSSLDQGTGVRRSRSGMIQAAATATDNASQSLNVKIDLSLINYSSQVTPQTVSSSAPSATLTANLSSMNNKSGSKHDNNGLTDRNIVTQTHKSSSPRTTDGQRQSRNLRRRETRPRSQNPQPRGGSPARSVNVHNYNTRSFPHSWCDNSDNSESSDDTYVPGSDRNETDVTISDEEYETDTSYEVQVPKSAAELLREYGSDESDTEWTEYLDS